MSVESFGYIVIVMRKISRHLSDFGFFMCKALECYIARLLNVQIQYKQHNVRGRSFIFVY